MRGEPGATKGVCTKRRWRSVKDVGGWRARGKRKAQALGAGEKGGAVRLKTDSFLHPVLCDVCPTPPSVVFDWRSRCAQHARVLCTYARALTRQARLSVPVLGKTAS